jgi:hypothetical protein
MNLNHIIDIPSGTKCNNCIMLDIDNRYNWCWLFNENVDGRKKCTDCINQTEVEVIYESSN